MGGTVKEIVETVSPMQMSMSFICSSIGEGFTVIVNDCGFPMQPAGDIGGVTLIVTDNEFPVLFSAIKFSIPVPFSAVMLMAFPMPEVTSHVQNTVSILSIKEIFTESPAQKMKSSIGISTGNSVVMVVSSIKTDTLSAQSTRIFI